MDPMTIAALIMGGGYVGGNILEKILGIGRFSGEMALQGKMFDLEQKKMRTSALQARKEEAKMDQIMRDALRMKEKENNQNMMFHMMQMAEGRAARKQQTTMQAIASLGAGRRSAF